MSVFSGAEKLRLIMAAIAGAMIIATTGCSTAVGTDLPERTEVLKSLRDQGFLFNRHVISTVKSAENPNQILVTGQLARTEPDTSHVKDGLKVSQVQHVVVEKQGESWQVVSAPVLVRDQLTSRQRW
ncbi:MAG: hypothetical protein KUL75_04795 [Sterolibacterium sp.]|nr:hypothetical protein [Sterolibacterium sp.]